MASGSYEVVGDPSQAGLISVHEWGSLQIDPTIKERIPGITNIHLAEMALSFQEERFRPIVGTEAIDEALRQVSGGSTGVNYLVEGPSTNAVGAGVGTSGEVRRAKQVMTEQDIAIPMYLAQAYHIGRVILHARHEGIQDYVVPANLPREFRPEADQWGIRSREQWLAHEFLAVPALRILGKL